MIRIEGLFARSGKVQILNGIDLSIAAGEFVALVGPNGAGKTTLLRHLNGLRKPSGGRVVVGGLDTRRARINEFARSVGFLFQNPDHQIISSRVRDEIAFGLKHTGIPHAEWDFRVAEAAESVGLSALLDAEPFALARPLRQRVALASVLALRPKVLILDEPTSAQDERGAQMVMDIARRLNAEGVTVMLVSHDMELVSRYARRVLAMIGGKLVADLPVSDFFRDRALLEGAGLSQPGAYRLAAALGLADSSPTAQSIAAAVEAALSKVTA